MILRLRVVVVISGGIQIFGSRSSYEEQVVVVVTVGADRAPSQHRQKRDDGLGSQSDMDWHCSDMGVVVTLGEFVRVNLGRIDLRVEFGRIDLCAGPTRCYTSSEDIIWP
eukprot:scaffold2453_cov113-Skeletonema_marinoi.AAC.2